MSAHSLEYRQTTVCLESKHAVAWRASDLIIGEILTDKTPWLKDPSERRHTKIQTDEVTGMDEEVPCTCQYWDEGETHYDFDGM
ncbi:hypothetical protein [Streptomyces sp. NPDC056405]|uniref:hypothetical protein n=1 Tax=Streptomyces sp. NPDC056405 TaxID=3345811 RepID=UPI0035E02771